MNSISEITNLFAKLACRIQTLKSCHENEDDDEDKECDSLILNLNRSLNLNEVDDDGDDSRVRVLDTALSLMCFKAPQVYDSLVEYNVRTIVAVLSSLIYCRVLRFQKDEILQIGGTISCGDSVELIEACEDVVRKLSGNGKLSHSLLYAVVRVLMSVSCFRYMHLSTPIYEVSSSQARSAAISKLLGHFPNEISNTKDEIPLRLQLWYLDPLTLKHDISKVLQDYIERPFLNLINEFHARMDWRSIVVCLALSPFMFIETRALLHNWFLATSRVPVLQLLTNLVAVVLDVVTRPTWWGMSVEIGAKLPFSNAYFPYNHHFLRILNGPVQSETFLQVVDITRGISDPYTKQSARKISILDHKSYWAIAMNFPEWFCFASSLLFHERSFRDGFNSNLTSKDACEVNIMIPSAAARYIAWILSPLGQSRLDLLQRILIKTSESWNLKQRGVNTLNKEGRSYRKKLKKSKFHDKREDHSLLKEIDHETILCWLKEFQDICVTNRDHDTYNSTYCEGSSLNLLYRRIPLGILIGCSDNISEQGCKLLLQYAATGKILNSNNSLNLHSKRPKDTIITTEECTNKKDAITGACLVFNLSDIIEKMSASLFASEEGALEFMCRNKLRTSKYLIECLNKLVQDKINKDDEYQMIMDLCSRTVHWRHQGRDCFEGNNDLDDVINALSYKLSSFLGDFE